MARAVNQRSANEGNQHNPIPPCFLGTASMFSKDLPTILVSSDIVAVQLTTIMIHKANVIEQRKRAQQAK
jgi:hypothetical protein